MQTDRIETKFTPTRVSWNLFAVGKGEMIRVCQFTAKTDRGCVEYLLGCLTEINSYGWLMYVPGFIAFLGSYVMP